jgi:hypothetical protein
LSLLLVAAGASADQAPAQPPAAAAQLTPKASTATEAVPAEEAPAQDAPAPDAPAEAEAAEAEAAEAHDAPVAPAVNAVRIFPAIRLRAAAVRLAAPAALPVDAPAAPPDDALVDAMLAQLNPLAHAELSFANRVCQLDADQRDRVAEALRGFLLKFARERGPQLQGNQQVIAFGGVVQLAEEPNVSMETAFSEGIAAALEGALSEEQRQTYRDERKQREAYFRDVAIDNYVAKLDQRIVLTAEQAANIRAELQQRWNSSWAPPLHAFVQLSNYLPDVPAAYVAPHLGPEQRKLFRSIQQVHFGGEVLGQRLGIGGELPMIDDVQFSATEAQP